MFNKVDLKELDIVQNIDTFTLEGELFLGNAAQQVEIYNRVKPSSKFRTWLIDNRRKVYQQA